MAQHCRNSRSYWLAAVAAIVAIASNGCSATPEPSPSRVPLAFGSGTVVGTIPNLSPGESRYQRLLPGVLDQSTAYIGSNTQVLVTDAGSGQVKAVIRPQHPPLATGNSPEGPPLLTAIGDSKVVLWPFLVTVPDTSSAAPTPAPGTSGTASASPDAPPPPDANNDLSAPLPSSAPSSNGASTPPSGAAGPNYDNSGGPEIELATIAAGTGSATDVLIKLPGWATTSTSALSISPLGVVDNSVLLEISDGVSHAVVASDATTGKVLWARDNFAAGALTANTVVGVEPDGAPATTGHVVGLSATNGQPRWGNSHGYGTTVLAAGPKFVAVTDRSSSDGSGRFRLISAASGDQVTTLPISADQAARCVYDQVSVAVCFTPSGLQSGARTVVGFDSQTGRKLWQMPDFGNGQSVAPLVTAAWHGLIYGTNDDGMTAVYQAQTGGLLRSSPGPAPTVVDDVAGLSPDVGFTHILTRPGLKDH